MLSRKKRIKLIRKIFISLLLLIQLVFLVAIFRENLESLWLSASVLLIFPLILVAYLRGQLHHREHQYEHILVVLWIPVGALSSFYLNNHVGLGPVISAAAIGAIGSFIPQLRAQSNYLKQLPTAIYCGAFIGMTSTRVAPDIIFVLTSSFFTAILILVSKSLFSGVGGKLGTLAFTGVVLTSFIYHLIFRYA